MKRFFEIIFCLIIILILLPIILLIIISIKIDTRGPIIFFSKRVGVNNSIFIMPKFRTMFRDTEIVESSKLINTDSKITKVGKFLRKYSLDELPQFLSVIQGNMKIVGPRPALPSQNELLVKRKKLGIHKLKPGITGYAQINGRDDLSILEKVILDTEYLKRKSLLFDLKILFITFFRFFSREGISH